MFCQTCYGKLRQLCKKISFLQDFNPPQPMPPSDPAKMHLCGVKGAKKETLRKKGGREGRWPRKQKKVGQNNSSRKSRQGGGEGGKQAAEAHCHFCHAAQCICISSSHRIRATKRAAGGDDPRTIAVAPKCKNPHNNRIHVNSHAHVYFRLLCHLLISVCPLLLPYSLCDGGPSSLTSHFANPNSVFPLYSF